MRRTQMVMTSSEQNQIYSTHDSLNVCSCSDRLNRGNLLSHVILQPSDQISSIYR